MADRDLKLNSLSRYSKESPLLILEEHGHCEVPAGCGGVVLRWRDPRAGVPLVIGLYAEGECTTLLDGQPPPAARTVVPFGEHVLGFVVSGFDPGYLVLMVSVANQPPSRAVSRVEDPVSFASAADGTWRYTVDRPADDGWSLPGFDDSGWAGLVARPDRRPPDDPDRDYATYRIDRLARRAPSGWGCPSRAVRTGRTCRGSGSAGRSRCRSRKPPTRGTRADTAAAVGARPPVLRQSRVRPPDVAVPAVRRRGDRGPAPPAHGAGRGRARRRPRRRAPRPDRAVLRALLRARFLHRRHPVRRRRARRRTARRSPGGPLAVHLEVVSACNLTCTHCFAGDLPRRERRLTLDELDRLFAEMASLGSFRLGLTGGEPLLRKDLFEIVDLAVGHGLAPCVTTNGLLLTEDIAREFGRRELVWLNVSLEGASAATNDRVRGEGTFDRVLDKLTMLRRHARFTLAFTVMRTNVDEIDACARLARGVGADTAVFRPLYPVGVATRHLELMPSFAEYNSALNTLADIDANTMDLRQIDPFGPYSRAGTQSVVHQNYGCGAGNLVCSVSVSGDVNPCSFLGPRFVAANVRDSSLAEIWHHSTGFRAIRALPHSEPGSARGNTATFAGGCRARALVLNGSVNAPDPWIDGQVDLERHTAATVASLGDRPTVSVHNPLSIVDVRAVR